MSRIGKQPIPIPLGTEVHIDEHLVTIKGPLGELTRSFRNTISIIVTDRKVVVTPKKETLFTRALWGTTASHIYNMIKGVNEAFEKGLIIEGVGYRAEISGENLVLHVGFSHLVTLPVPSNVKVVVEKNTITISGMGKEAVGQFAATVRAVKKPEPYKGKGIRYKDEVIRRKQGKRAV